MSALPSRDPLHPPPVLLASPSLVRDAADTPAFEVKFVLTTAQAEEVNHRLRDRLVPDPHADPANGGYRVTSVYFDTPAFDVYRRSDRYRRRKFRVRRYGAAPVAFLEQKSKSGPKVRKRRTDVPLVELADLAGDPPADWPGSWFARKLAARGLRPVCRVSYERLAFVGTTAEGGIRATFDRAAVGVASDGLVPEPVRDGRPLLADEVIAEFKFLGAMPAVFKAVVEDLRLAPRSLSKYRRCLEAVGLVTGDGTNA